MLLGGIEGRLHAGPVGDIEDYRQRLTALRFDLGDELREPLDAPRRQYHAGTGTSRQPRQVRADAAGGAGNQHHAIGEGEVLGVIVIHR
ncbi:hypothetical protein D3C84_262070 [compost metagenome]